MELSASIIGLVGTIVGGGAVGAILTFISMSRKNRRDDFTVFITALKKDNDELRERVKDAERSIIEMHKERAQLMAHLAKLEAKIIHLEKQQA